MIRFLLQVLPERLLERLGSAEEERLHRPLRAAERRGHVAVGEAVDTREEKGCALLRRQLADRRLELTRQLAGRCALLGRDRRGVGELRALAAVVVVPRLPEVDPEVPLGAPELVQAEVGGDGEEPGREAALGPVAADVVVPSPSPIGSPGRFISPTLAGAMRGEILREGTVASQTRTHSDTRPGTHDRPRSCACPGPFWRLPWGARSC